MIFALLCGVFNVVYWQEHIVERCRCQFIILPISDTEQRYLVPSTLLPTLRWYGLAVFTLHTLMISE